MLALDTVRTEVFDGPLELLLYLVRQQGVDLRSLRIAPITDAFLAQLEVVDALDLDHAGDFLVMAATLCWLKSRELVGARGVADGEDDEEEDLREQLVRRLREYGRYAEAADELGRRPLLGRDVFAAPPREPEEPGIDAGVDALGLLEIYDSLLRRSVAPPPVHDVEREPRSIEELATWLLDRLRPGPRELGDLLRAWPDRADRVLLFLAALELVRLGALDARQERHLGPVVLLRRGGPEDVDLGLLVGEAS